MRPPIICEWELTRACNFSCAHCSVGAGERDPRELSPSEALRVAEEMAALGCHAVTLTGGEPLTRPDWQGIASTLIRHGVGVSVLSNGWLIQDAMARRLRDVGIAEVVLSVDGVGARHDQIRGKPGAFEQVLRAVASLKQAGVPVAMTTTVFRQTLRELPALHELAVSLGIERWHVLLGKRPETSGRGEVLCDWLLPGDLRMLVSSLRGFENEGRLNVIVGDNVGSECRSCEAGLSLLSLDALGQVKGCLTMPSRAPFLEGSVRDSGLRAIWDHPGAFSYNRGFRMQQLAGRCRACPEAKKCRGGCHWSTDFATTGVDNPFCLLGGAGAGVRRRGAALSAAVAVGLGLALSGCAHREQDAKSVSGVGNGFPCMIERNLREPATPECRALRDDLARCSSRCCFSRAIVPPDKRQECVGQAERFKDRCIE